MNKIKKYKYIFLTILILCSLFLGIKSVKAYTTGTYRTDQDGCTNNFSGYNFFGTINGSLQSTYMCVTDNGTTYDAFCLNHSYKYCRNNSYYSLRGGENYENLAFLVAAIYTNCGSQLICKTVAQASIWALVQQWHNGNINNESTSVTLSSVNFDDGSTDFLDSSYGSMDSYISNAIVPINTWLGEKKPTVHVAYNDHDYTFTLSKNNFSCSNLAFKILYYQGNGDFDSCEGSVGQNDPNKVQLVSIFQGNCSKIVTKQGSIKVNKKSNKTQGPLDGVTFTLYNDGNCGSSSGKTAVTSGGSVTFSDLIAFDGSNYKTYSVKETATAPGYKINDTCVPLTFSDNNLNLETTVNNDELGKIKVIKKTTLGDIPLSGVQIQLCNDSSCNSVITTKTTGDNGEVIFDGIDQRTYWVKEVSAPKGYKLQGNGIYEVGGQLNGTVEKTIYNDKLASLKIIKSSSLDENIKVEGAKFRVTTNSDCTGGNTYVTNAKGEIEIENIDQGNYYVCEIEAPAGYRIIESEKNKTVAITLNATKEFTVKVTNRPVGSLEVIKKSSYGNKKVLAGAKFNLSKSADCSNMLYSEAKTTDNNGKVVFNDLTIGNYYVCEVEAPRGYKIADKSKAVEVTQEKKVSEITNSVTFYDDPITSLVVTKDDKQTGELLNRFKIGLYETDCETVAKDINGKAVEAQLTRAITDDGYGSNLGYGVVEFKDLKVGEYCVVEMAIDGYYQEIEAGRNDLDGDGEKNTTLRQIVILTEDNINGNHKRIRMENDPLGAIVVQKYDKKTGEVLKGAEFELYKCDSQYENCKIVKTDANGKEIIKEKTVGKEKYYYLCTDSTCKTTGTDSNGVIFIDNLLYGYYAVAERVAPTMGNQGYVMITKKIEVKELNEESRTCVSRPGENTVDKKPCMQVDVKDEAINLKIEKLAKDEEGNVIEEKLKGAIFQINEFGSTDIFDEVIITEEDGVVVAIKPGQYVIKEITSPTGYALDTTEVVFTVNELGKVKIDEFLPPYEEEEEGPLEDEEEVMVEVAEERDKEGFILQVMKFYDKPSNMMISKQDILTGEELPGATLELKCEDGYEQVWESGEEPKEFEIRDDVVCRLRETISPEGYEVELNELEFKLDDKGNVKSLVNLGNDSNFHVESNRVTLFNGFKVPATASVKSVITIICGVIIMGVGLGFLYYAYRKKEN